MRGKTCGEETNFVLIRQTAKWNFQTQNWEDEIDSPEEPMCSECDSFNVEYEDGDAIGER